MNKIKITHYQGKVATLRTKWQQRDTMREIINRQKNAEKGARLVRIFGK